MLRWDDCVWKVNCGVKDDFALETRESFFQMEMKILTMQMKEANEELAMLEALDREKLRHITGDIS